MKRTLLTLGFALALLANGSSQRLIPVFEEGQVLPSEFGLGPNGTVMKLLTSENGIWLLGSFDSCNATITPNIAFWDGDEFSFPGGETFPNEFQPFDIIAGDGGFYICGLGDSDTESIWFFDGEQWSAVPGSIANGRVTDLILYDSDVLAAGEFTDFDGVPMDRMAYLQNGVWVNFGDGIDNKVNDLIVHESSLYACGHFANFNGGELNRIAKFNGAEWEQVGMGLDNKANTMIEYEGELLVGGRFSATAGDEQELDMLALIDEDQLLQYPSPGEETGMQEVDGLSILEGDLVASSGALNYSTSTSAIKSDLGWESTIHAISTASEFEGKTLVATDPSGDESYFRTQSFFNYEKEGELFEVCSNSELDVKFNALPSTFTDIFGRVRYNTQPFEQIVGSIYSSALWYGGESEGEVFTTGNRYGLEDHESLCGPYSELYDQEYFIKYYRLWKVTSDQIDEHIQNFNEPDYQMPEAFKNWPGNGRVDHGESPHLAPFVDVNANGWYDPALGDYPLIQGDECITLISNDSRAIGLENSPGMEIVSQYFLFDTAGDIARTLHTKHFVSNKSNRDYEAFSMGVWTDFDIGTAYDDYIGCSPENNLFYAYNGDAYDEPSVNTIGYGENAPAQGVVFPNRDMSSFMTYSNSANPISGEPSTPIEFHNYLNSSWRNGQSLLYGGDGLNTAWDPDSIVSFLFPDLPGLSGESDWNETTSGNPAGDRRGVGAVEPFPLLAGEQICFDYLYVHAFKSNDDLYDEVSQLFQSSEIAKENYNQLNLDCSWEQFPLSLIEVEQIGKLNLYPNPANESVSIKGLADLSHRILVLDISGKQVQEITLNAGDTELDITQLPQGIYLVQISSETGTTTLRLIKN